MNNDNKEIKSLKDPKAVEMARQCPPGKSSYYYVIGHLGGEAVKQAYKDWPNRPIQ